MSLLLGVPLVYLLSGFPLARLVLQKEKHASLRLIITSFAFSLFLTYPAAVLTTILEGQSGSAIYQVHLPYSLFSLTVTSLPFWLLILRKRLFALSFPQVRVENVLLFLSIAVYSLFVFSNLGRADILGDDYDLGYQAYNLHDGIFAARKAFIISFNTHPPLMMTIKHYGMQLFSPWGLDSLSSWMFRGVEGIMGIGIILVSFLLVKEFVSKRAAVLVAILLAVNNYLVFFGRYFEREIYLVFFLLISSYYLLHKRFFLAAFFLGCGFLVKTSAIALLPVFILLLWPNIRKILSVMVVIFLVYFPVLIYNFTALLLIGKMDATFSWLFRLPHPFLTGSTQSPILVNPPTIFFLLSDLFGWPIFLFTLVGVLIYIFKEGLRTPLGKLLLFWSIGSLLFLSLGPIRGYYLLPLAIPLIIISSIAWSKHPWIILPLIAFSIIYSYNSNLVSQRSALTLGETGAGGNYSLLATRFWHTDFSIVAATYSFSAGWPELVEEVAGIYKSGDCLEKGRGVNDLNMRAYFQTDDTPKKSLLGGNYPHYYKMCDEVSQLVRKIHITYNSRGFITHKIIQ